MNDEMNARNHHHPHDETGANSLLPLELEALSARLSADGAVWQSQLPDIAPVAQRIRAIPYNTAIPVADAGIPFSADTITLPEGTRRQPRIRVRRGAPTGGAGRFFGLVAAVLIVALLATVFVSLANRTSPGPAKLPTPTQAQPVPTAPPPTATAATAAPTATPTGHAVLVYFSKQPDSYSDPDLVFPVHRSTPNLGVATFAIQQLIAGPTDAEAARGYFTQLSGVLQRSGPANCGGADFKITLNKRGATPETGTATLRFCRPTASPGIGADARIKAETTKTLTQFSNIKTVVILLRDGHCFGDESGMDLCLQ
jgi:hypothetical protein